MSYEQREKNKRILEDAGLLDVSNSTVDDIIEASGSLSREGMREIVRDELCWIQERLEKVEEQLGIEED